MKKLLKLLLLVLSVTIVFSLCACIQSITCLSHVDANGDGRCDNCHQKVVITTSNIKSVTIKTMPTKLYYALNSKLETDGGVLTVTFNDETPAKDISFSDEGVSVSAPGMNSKGQKLVGVTYGGKTATYTIEVGDARFTVSFNLGYEGATPIPEQTVTINNLAEAPSAPVRVGYDFVGWFTDETKTALFDFDITVIMDDVEVYAKWIQKFAVTYSDNFDGGSSKDQMSLNGKADSTVAPSARDGYIFAGWFSDSECETAFSFNTTVDQAITLYAKWVSNQTTTYAVTFNVNYGAAPATTTADVPENSKAVMPAAPTRANVTTKGHQATGFEFLGWFKEAACVNAYDFNTPITADITLYAKWKGTYIFEAEHVALVNELGMPLVGLGASGSSEGPNMVDSPSPGMEGVNASNGYYLTYLYSTGLTINFFINSDRDVSDATLVFRISIENSPIALDPMFSEGTADGGTQLSRYVISLNGDEIDYETIEITDATGHASGRRPFSDFTIAVNLTLEKGMNVFSFTADNANGMGGTMAATAPVIDCIKIITSAALDWDPVTSNEFGQ